MFENLKPGDKIYIVPSEPEECPRCYHKAERKDSFSPREVEIQEKGYVHGDAVPIRFDGNEFFVYYDGWVCTVSIACQKRNFVGMAYHSKEDYENYINLKNEIRGLLVYLNNANDNFVKGLRKNTPEERMAVMHQLQNIVQIIKPGTVPYWRDR